MQLTASALIGLALVAFVWPRVVAFPLAVVSAWCAVALAVKAYRLRAGRVDAPITPGVQRLTEAEENSGEASQNIPS
jgi:hypothetical protein